MYADTLLQPWLAEVLDLVPDVGLFDCHNHVGERDPSGFSSTFAELEESLVLAGGRSVVTPAADPDGYEQANKACTDAARESAGRLVAFARLEPGDRPTELLRQALAAGARGVKLHGSSDGFAIEDPRLEEVYEIADAENLPVLVHAGPELEGVGRPALRICRRHPGLRMILAHCALTDLGWIWREVRSTPNLFFDTAWWTPAHLMALFRLVPPGRVLMASDLPYASPVSGALSTLRCAWQAGLGPDQVRSVAGAQLAALLEGGCPADRGPAPDRERRPPGPLLEILSSNLLTALEPMQRGEPPGVPLTVARRICDIDDHDPDADVIASVARLLALYDEHHERLPPRNQFAPGWDLVSAAAFVARTPAATAST